MINLLFERRGAGKKKIIRDSREEIKKKVSTFQAKWKGQGKIRDQLSGYESIWWKVVTSK